MLVNINQYLLIKSHLFIKQKNTQLCEEFVPHQEVDVLVRNR